MPQFEVEDPAAHAEVSRIRARSAEEAVRGWLGLTADTAVHLEKATAALDELEGWREIWIDGARRGRIRPFQRMRFRRD